MTAVQYIFQVAALRFLRPKIVFPLFRTLQIRRWNCLLNIQFPKCSLVTVQGKIHFLSIKKVSNNSLIKSLASSSAAERSVCFVGIWNGT